MDSVPSNESENWAAVQQTVLQFHKNVGPLLRRIPHSLALRQELTHDGLINRVYFLVPPAGQRENTIMFVDIPMWVEQDVNKSLHWKMLLDPNQVFSFTDKVSPEEQLLRERKRIRSTGITSFDFQNFLHSGRFAFSANSSLYTCSDAFADGRFSFDCLTAREIPTLSTNARLDVKLCPCNPNLVAYISGSDLWVSNTTSGLEHQLTFVGKESIDAVGSKKSAGIASFVVQEEFDRCTGYWWQPSTTEVEAGVFQYRILYEEVDESEVSVLNIVPPDSNGDRVDTYRYPRAGTSNARSDLKIIEFKATSNGILIYDIKELTLERRLSENFPRMEYLLRAGWVPNTSWVYAEVIDRQQTFLQIGLLDVKSFDVARTVELMDDDNDDTLSKLSSSSPLIIYEESSDVWVRVHNLLYFTSESRGEDTVSFIIGSEKSGFLHLYHIVASAYNSDGSRTIASYGPYGSYYKAGIVKESAITSGDWEVDGKQLWVSEKKKLIFFIGYKDTPLESHLYVTSYDTSTAVKRLTELGFSHAIEMNEERSVYATVYSSLMASTECRVYSILCDNNEVTSKFIGTVLQCSESPDSIHAPELFNYVSPANGYTMYGMIFRPADFDPTQKYPAVVFVYGGPQFQLVSNSFKAVRLLRLHILASFGFIVVVLDGRGSDHRGLKYAAEIKHKLGTVEVEDQVEGLKWLSSQYGFIDMNRIGIHGWSYGGYLSLKCLLQYPDIFKVAVAGAPVTSWHLYDTGYTERYLDTPANNPDAYRASSVIDHVDKLPNEEGRLLIIQGMMDENVHFYHTSSLVDALVKSCKPHALQIYPNERHGIRNIQVNQHYETMLVCFLKKHLS